MGKRELYRNKQALANAAPLAQAHSQPLGITIGARTSNVKMPKEAIPAIYYEKILKYMKTKEMLNDIAGACTKYLYKPSDWKYYYFEHRWKEYANVRRALRKLIQMGTLQVLLRGKYYKEDQGVSVGASASSDTKNVDTSNNQSSSSASEEVLQVKEEEEEEYETFVIGGRTLSRKKYTKPSASSSSDKKKVIQQEEEIQIDEEIVDDYQPINNNKKNKKKNKKNKKKKDSFESDEEDEINQDDEDGTFDGFEITKDEDRPQLYELNEWKDDPKKKKKNKQNKKQGKKQTREQAAASLEIEQDDFVKEEESIDGIPSKAIHIDFNNIKKIVKGTEKIDCAEYESVQNIALNLTSRKSKEESSVSQKTVIQVVKGDMLETAISLRKVCKLNPLVLVSGSQTVPGGSFAKGGNTQEEDFCRRSSLSLSIADPYRFDENREWTYPLPEFGGIYAPNVVVLRGPKSGGYAYLDNTCPCSMFVTYPYVNPPTEKRKVADPNTVIPNEDEDEEVSTESFLSTKLANSMKKKIASYFDVALKKGHDSLVIGALGCENTHSNPAYHIAQLFREVLSSEIFKDKFKVVIFSILVDIESDSKLANENGSEEVEEVEENDESEDVTAANLLENSVGRKNNLSVFSKLFHGKEEAPTAEEFIPTIECK